MKNTIAGTLALALVMAFGCGDDGGDGDGNEEETTGDAGSLTLEEALKTSGSNVSQARVDLVFPAACDEQIKCDMMTKAQCLAANKDVFEAMVSSRSTACRDATLDLYSCFAVTPCADYDTDDTCNEIGERQDTACQ